MMLAIPANLSVSEDLRQLDEKVQSGNTKGGQKTKQMMKQESKDFAMQAFKEMDQNKDEWTMPGKLYSICCNDEDEPLDFNAKQELMTKLSE